MTHTSTNRSTGGTARRARRPLRSPIFREAENGGGPRRDAHRGTTHQDARRRPRRAARRRNPPAPRLPPLGSSGLDELPPRLCDPSPKRGAARNSGPVREPRADPREPPPSDARDGVLGPPRVLWGDCGRRHDREGSGGSVSVRMDGFVLAGPAVAAAHPAVRAPRPGFPGRPRTPRTGTPRAGGNAPPV